MDHTIVHFEIPADDPERAAKFYRELFGWEIKKFEGGEMEYWTISTVPTDAQGKPTRPGVNGGLMRRMYPGHAPVNYIAVDDVDGYVAKAGKLGAKVMMGKTPVPGMGWFAQFGDPEGNVFAVWQHDPTAAGTVGAGVDPERAKG